MLKKTRLVSVFTSLALMLALAILPTGAALAADDVITLRMASMYMDPSAITKFNSGGLTQAKFAELVAEKSGGRVKIQNFFNSVLGGETDMLGQVQSGDIDLFYGNVYSSSSKRFGATTIPYLFDTIDQVTAAVNSPDAPIFKLTAPWFEEMDVKLLAMGVGALRGFISTEQVILPTDVKGMKVRTIEDAATNIFWGGLGTAVPMPISEVYSALQTKTIEGLEAGMGSILGRKYDEVAKFYVDINWNWTNASNIMINPEVFNDLPADLQQIISDCAWEAARFHAQTEASDMQVAIGELKARGVTVYELSDAERQAWKDYARGLDDKLKAEIGAETFDAMMAAANSVK